MEIMVMLIAISLAVACFFLGAFIWSVRSGQFEDTVTPAVRILDDDDKPFKGEELLEHDGDHPVR
jgi:cbb3-type cytochrome oxidase maturation protein